MGDLDDECEWYYLDNTRMTRVATRMTCVTRISRMTGGTLMSVMSVIT